LTGNAQGADGGVQRKRQQDSIVVGLDYTNGLLGDVPLNVRRDIDHEKRLLDGGSEISRQGGSTYNNNGQNNGGLLGGLLGRAEQNDDVHAKRLLDGGSEISQTNCAGNAMQKRLLDGGSEITRCNNNGLLGNILSRDSHDNDKRLLDGGSELSSTGNNGLLGGLLSRDVEEKRLLDFWSLPENGQQQQQQYQKRLLDFGRGRGGQRRPEKDEPETAATGPEKRLLDFASAPSSEGQDGLLGLKRSVDGAMDKRLVDLGADLDDTLPLEGIVKKSGIFGGLLGEMKASGSSFGTASGRTNRKYQTLSA
jgi:hypothetical protein